MYLDIYVTKKCIRVPRSSYYGVIELKFSDFLENIRFPEKTDKKNIRTRIFDKYPHENGYCFETGYFSGHLGPKNG